MMLAGGFPRIDCVCPNGSIMRFCVGSMTDNACCCAGSCCGNTVASTGPDSQAAKKSCSCHFEQSGCEKKGQGAGQNPCRKQLADSANAGIVPARVNAAKDGTGFSQPLLTSSISLTPNSFAPSSHVPFPPSPPPPLPLPT